MKTRRLLLALCVATLGTVFGLAVAPASAVGVTRTWTGSDAASNLWSDADNWDTGVPLAGDLLVFPAGAARKVNVNDLAANTVFESITFTGSGYEVSGNDLGLSAGLVNQPGGGTNVVLLDIAGAGAITNQSARLVLDGDNSYTGLVSVLGGTLAATSDSALGSPAIGTVAASGATLSIGASVDAGDEPIQITGDGDDGFGALQSLGGTNRANDVTVAGASTIGVFNSTLVIDTLSGGPELVLLGGGKLQVENSFYTGALNVFESNLTWNGSSQAFVEVDPFGLLRGTGTVASAHVIGGMIWPGSGSSPGILTVFGATTFSGGILRVDLDGPAAGSGYGQLSTAGVTLTPDATLLELDLSFQPVIGQVFTIIDNAGGEVAGTFLNLPEGATFTAEGFAWRISYAGGDGNDVTITVVRQVTADLKLEMVASPSPVAAGGLLTYSIAVTNLGPDAASTPRVTMGTPVGTTFESATGPANWSCSKPVTSASISCLGPTFPSGAVANFTFVFRVNNGAGGPISGTAGVSTDTNDLFSANNAVTLNTGVGPGGGLAFRLFLGGLARDAALPAND